MVWRWDSDAFGTTAANENPAGVGVFSYGSRFPGQYYDAETGLNYNYFRDYDPSAARYVQSDPVGLLAGVNTYAYVDANSLTLVDPNGLGKEQGQRSLGGNDPLIPRDINRNTPRERVDQQIQRIDEEIKANPGMNKNRLKRLRAWQKIARRGFTKAVCPPLLEDIVLLVLREQCLRGDITACQSYSDLGGEVEGELGWNPERWL
jgi:RHS repeat-associated protein